jgi:hypothetical protein
MSWSDYDKIPNEVLLQIIERCSKQNLLKRIATVYFIKFIIKENEQVQAFFKIGYTNDLDQRMKELRTKHRNVKDLKILYTFNGTLQDEQDLHKKFMKYRISGDYYLDVDQEMQIYFLLLKENSAKR